MNRKTCNLRGKKEMTARLLLREIRLDTPTCQEPMIKQDDNSEQLRRSPFSHCCDPVLSILVILVSRNVFHVLSSLQPTVCLNFFWLILSLVDLTLATFIAYGPLRFLVTHVDFISLLAIDLQQRSSLKDLFGDNLIKSVGNIKST